MINLLAFYYECRSLIGSWSSLSVLFGEIMSAVGGGEGGEGVLPYISDRR